MVEFVGAIHESPVSSVQIVHSRTVEDAVPYDHEIVQKPSTVRDWQAFYTVGDGALDVP